MNPYAYEFCSRGCFYALKFTLIYILTQYYEMSTERSFEIFALLTAQCFVSPLISGYIADKFSTAYTSLLIGLVIQLFGFLCILNQGFLDIGYSLIVIAFGITKTGILKLLKQNEYFQNNHVTKLYAITNLSAFILPVIAGYIGENFGWQYSVWLLCLITFIGLLITLIINIKRKIKIQNLNNIIKFLFFATLIWISSYASFYFKSILLFLIFCIIFILATHKRERIKQLIDQKIILLSGMGFAYFFFSEQPNYGLSLYILNDLDRSFDGFTLPANAITGCKTLLIFALGIYCSCRKENIERKTFYLYNRAIISAILMLSAFTGFTISQTLDFNRYHKILIIIFSYSAIAASEIILIPILIQKVLSNTTKKFDSIQVGVFYALASLGMFFAKYIQNIYINQTVEAYKFLATCLLFLIIGLILFKKRFVRSI